MIKLIDILHNDTLIKEGSQIDFSQKKELNIDLPKSKLCEIINNFTGLSGPIKINEDYSINVHKIYRASDFGKMAGKFIVEASVSAYNHEFGYVEDPKTKKISSPTENVKFNINIK